MEFYACGGSVEFVGYSLFTAENGAYTGNVLASNAEIEKHLSQYISTERVVEVREALRKIMLPLLADSGYSGYFGIDMMLYDNGGECCLNPCMEVNMRMNMGVVSRLFYDRFVSAGKRGIYKVSFFKQPGEAWHFHQQMQAMHPLNVQDCRVEHGYMALSPVTPKNKYIAYAIIEP